MIAATYAIPMRRLGSWTRASFHRARVRASKQRKRRGLRWARLIGLCALAGHAFAADVARTADPEKTVVDMLTNHQMANGQALNVAQVTVRDTHGDPVRGERVTFSPVPNYTFTPPLDASQRPYCESDAQGICTISMTTTAVGSQMLVGHLDGMNIPLPSQATSVFTIDLTNPPGGVIQTFGGQSTGADGVTPLQVVVWLRDGQTAIPGRDVRFLTDLGALIPTFPGPWPGEYATNLRSAMPGIATVRFTVDGVGSDTNVLKIPFYDLARSTLTMETNGAPANGTTTNAVRLTPRDSAGLPGDVPASVEIILPPNVKSDSPGCLTLGGSCTVGLTSTVAGTYLLSAKFGPGNLGRPFGHAQATFVAGPADPAQSTLAVSAGDRLADGLTQHHATATIHDANSNSVAGQIVHFAVTDASLTRPTCTTGTDGTCSTELRSTVPGTKSVQAGLGDHADPALSNSPQPARFIAGPADPARSTLAVSAGDRMADGLTQHHAVVTIRDAMGHAVTGQIVHFAVTDASLTRPTCTTTADGTCSTELRSTVAGIKHVQAGLGDHAHPALGNSPQPASFVAQAPSPAHFTLQVSPGDKLANGKDEHSATITSRNAAEQLVGGISVRFSAPDAQLHPATCTTSAVTATPDFGTCTIKLTATEAGRKTVTAHEGDTPVGYPQTVNFITDPGAVAPEHPETRLRVTIGDRIADTRDYHEATIQTVNSQGSPVAGVTVALAAQGASLSAPRCVTTADGTCTVSITTNLQGAKEVTARIGERSMNGSPAYVSFIANVPDPEHPDSRLTVTTDGDKEADGAAFHTVMASVVNKAGHPTPPQWVDLEVSDAHLSDSRCMTNATSGTCTVNITAITPGAKTVRATVLGTALGSPVQVRFVGGSAAIHHP